MTAVNRQTLRLLRLTARLSLDEIGRRIGVSGSWMSRIERGYVNLPPEQEHRWLAALTGVRLPEGLTSKNQDRPWE